MNSNSENPGVGKAFQGKEHMIMEISCFFKYSFFIKLSSYR